MFYMVPKVRKARDRPPGKNPDTRAVLPKFEKLYKVSAQVRFAPNARVPNSGAAPAIPVANSKEVHKTWLRKSLHLFHLILWRVKEKKMKLNAAGLASALVILAAVSMFRMGDKPTFVSVSQEEEWLERVKAQVTGAQKRSKKPYRGDDL